MFIKMFWFAAVLTCSEAGETADCREHLLGAFTDSASCASAIAEVRSILAGFPGAVVAGQCFSIAM